MLQVAEFVGQTPASISGVLNRGNSPLKENFRIFWGEVCRIRNYISDKLGMALKYIILPSC